MWQINGEDACRRLLSFGLLDRSPDPADAQRLACTPNQLASPRIEDLDSTTATTYIESLLTALLTSWPHERCAYVCDVELCRFAHITQDAITFEQRAETALGYLDQNHHYGVGFPLAKSASALVADPAPDLARTIANLIRKSSTSQDDLQQCRDLYAKAIRGLEEPSNAKAAVTYGALLRDEAELSTTLGDLDEAFASLEQVRDLFEQHDLIRERAVTLGDIARIKVSRGEVDDALQLHEERKHVFESLGDQRSRAVTLGDIARIKVSRGEVDDVLQLHDERLACQRRIGDKAGIAAAQNDRFDILWQKEDFQAAVEAISESFQCVLELGRMDGIGVVGTKFGQVLAASGRPEQARQVLDDAKQAWEKLKIRQW